MKDLLREFAALSVLTGFGVMICCWSVLLSGQ